MFTSVGLWSDHHCESNFMWMCKKQPDSNTTLTTPEPTVSQGHCPPFYHQYRDRCYNLGPEPLSYDEALNLCGSLHPDNMVSIRDQKEQGKHVKYFGNPYQNISWVNVSWSYSAKILSAFLSSLLFNRDIPVWIGAKQSHEGEFWWSDNSPITYTNWYPGQPNGTKGVSTHISVCIYVQLKLKEKVGNVILPWMVFHFRFSIAPTCTQIHITLDFGKMMSVQNRITTCVWHT